jgi:oxygen-dependent protoporphyrinogen oxidase
VEHEADAVVIATPASVAAGLLASVDGGLADKLKAIRYVSTATVSLGYPRAALGTRNLDGYGFLVPAREGRSINACTWASTKFAHRAPDDQVLIRGFVGGEGKEHLVDVPDDELVDLVRGELHDLMGVAGEPKVRNIFRWPRGNPQYDVGHLDRVAQIEEATRAIPGLHLTGSSYRGVSVPDCIRQAQETAAEIMTNDEIPKSE